VQRFKQLFNFFIQSSIHVALSVCGLVWVTLLNFHIGVDLNFLYFIFFATITGYNFVKYFGLAKFHHRQLVTWLKHIQVFSLLCFLGMCYFAVKLRIETCLYFIVLGMITFIYAVPIIPKKIFIRGGKLREISGLKIYVIAFVWTCVTVIIPLLNENHQLNHEVLVESVQRYLYVFTAMLPFEIRDMQYDSLKLSTIPQRIGIIKTKILGTLSALLIFLIEFSRANIVANKLIILGVVCLLLILFLGFSRVKQPSYYSGFLVEGIPILWALLITLNF